jgi:hypothetical protein
MDCIYLDIKYVWIHGEKHNYYLLTILDVHTRIVLDKIIQRSIQKLMSLTLLEESTTNIALKVWWLGMIMEVSSLQIMSNNF